MLDYSRTVPRMLPSRSPLDDSLRRAGAVMVQRDGRCVAAHFGSPAGELAVCSSAVGLVDRSEIAKLELCGYPEALDQVVYDVSDSQLEPNEVLRVNGVEWCSASPDRVFALCEPALAFALSERLHEAALRAPGALLTDETDDLAALALLGPAAPSVVAALGAWNLETIGLPQPSFAATTLDGMPVYLLEESPMRMLILVERDCAVELWDLLERVGRPYGLSCVGLEAAERFSMVERQLAARPALA
jgi:glycine cleavage system aminomethyltransferase T